MMDSQRRRLGRRGRIGVIQPAPGVVLEHEWPRRLPAEVLFPVARIRMTGGAPADYAAVAAGAPAAAADLATAGAGVVGYACSVGSLYAGPAAETRLTESLAAAARCPAISIAAVSIRALASFKARRIVILTPYAADTNALVSAYAGANGLRVEAVAAFPVGLVQVGDLSPAEVASIAADVMAGCPAADALWIPCTAVQTLEAIEIIESRSGRPAVSGSQALLWGALRTLGIEDRIPHTGALLDQPFPSAAVRTMTTAITGHWSP